MSVVPIDGWSKQEGSALYTPATYQHQNEYTARLLMRLKHMRMYLEDPDHALTVDRDFYEKVRREPVINAHLEYREVLTAGRARDFSLVGGDEESGWVVPIYQKAYDRLKHFTQVRKHLAGAFWSGMTVAAIHGEWIDLVMPGDWQARRWWIPTSLEPIDKGRIRVEWEDPVGNELHGRQRWTVFDVDRQEWVVIDERNNHHFIWHKYDLSDRNLGWGGGLAAVLVYYWTIKTILLETSAVAAKRFGYGWVHAKVKHLLGAAGSTSLETYATIADQVIAQVEKQREHNVFVSDMDAVEMDVLNPAGTQSAKGTLVMSLLEYVDKMLTISIVGSLLPTGGGQPGAGSLARAEVEQDSTSALIVYGRDALAEAIQGVGTCFKLCNRDNLEALGAYHATEPTVQLGADVVEPEAKSRSLQMAGMFNIPVKKSDVYEALEGFSQPDANDEIMELMPAQPAGGAGGMGGLDSLPGVGSLGGEALP